MILKTLRVSTFARHREERIYTQADEPTENNRLKQEKIEKTRTWGPDSTVWSLWRWEQGKVWCSRGQGRKSTLQTELTMLEMPEDAEA